MTSDTQTEKTNDKDAEAAARFYAATFPTARSVLYYAPSDYPGGKEGDVLTVQFTVLGIPLSWPQRRFRVRA